MNVGIILFLHFKKSFDFKKSNDFLKKIDPSVFFAL